MSECDAALRQLSDLINGDLDGGDAAALDRHLASCETCYRQAVALLRQDRAFTQMAARKNLQAFQLPCSRQKRRFVLSTLVVGAAAAAAVLVAAFFVLQRPKPAMVLEMVSGDVMLDDVRAETGDEVRPGQALETRGGATASIRFGDATIVDVAGKSLVRNIREADGKRMTVVRGSVTAQVAPQTKPMIFESKSGEARVLGTALRLVVDDELEQTRLEVTEGKVQLTRWADKKSVDVAAGHFAIAAAGVELTARPLSKGKSPADLFQLDYATLRGMLQLKTKTWANLPWHVSVAEAREAAFREKKPILLFITSGHALGFVGQNGVVVRETIFGDAATVKLATEKFILLAQDCTVHPHPDEQPWLDKHQVGYRVTTYGLAVISPDGTRLAHGSVFDPGQARYIMTTALKAFKPPAGPLEEIPRKGGAPPRQPPQDGAILRNTWKAFYDKSDSGRHDPMIQEALGSDRVWVRKDEIDQMAQGKFPPSLMTRLLKHHLPVFAGRQTQINLAIDGQGRILGKANGDEPSEDVFFQGFVEVKDGKLVRFELLGRGEGTPTDDGFQASLSAAPKGKRIPTAVYFELADPTVPLNRIQPHHESATYLK